MWICKNIYFRKCSKYPFNTRGSKKLATNPAPNHNTSSNHAVRNIYEYLITHQGFKIFAQLHLSHQGDEVLRKCKLAHSHFFVWEVQMMKNLLHFLRTLSAWWLRCSWVEMLKPWWVIKYSSVFWLHGCFWCCLLQGLLQVLLSSWWVIEYSSVFWLPHGCCCWCCGAAFPEINIFIYYIFTSFIFIVINAFTSHVCISY